MNGRTAKLTNQFANLTRKSARGIRREWKRLPAKARAKVRRQMMRVLRKKP